MAETTTSSQFSSGFAYYLSRTHRTNPDWSEYYVNYAGIKSTLRAFLKRRNYVNNAMKQGLEVEKDDLFLERIPYNMSRLFNSPKYEKIFHRSWSSGKSCNNTKSEPELLIELDFDKPSSDDSTASDDLPGYVKIADESGKVMFRLPVEHNFFTIERLYELEKAEINYLLDCEIEKAVQFYNKQLNFVTEYFLTLNFNFTKVNDNQGEEQEVYYYLDEVPHENYVFVGNEMLELLAYAIVNIMALRQILIRYDAFVRSNRGKNLKESEWFLKSKTYETCGDKFQDMFNLRPLCTMKDTFSTRLHDLPLQYPNNEQAKETYLYWQRFVATFDKFMSFLDTSLNSLIKTSEGKITFKEHITTLLRDNFVLGSQALGLGYN